MKTALELLIEGNKRFAGKADKKKLADMAKGQKPYAVVVACSDSRVCPEINFDEQLGRIFGLKVAGNVGTSSTIIGSIEYAVEHLGSKLLVVLGHTHCGAVKATIQGGTTGTHIDALVKAISPAVEKARLTGATGKELEEKAVEENARLQMANLLKESKVLREKVESGELQTAVAIYDLDTGVVRFL